MGIRKENTKVAEKKEFTVEVIEKCGVISENGNSSLQLRYLRWNGGDPKYDIRPWYTDKNGVEKSGKGVTLTGEELERLGEIIAILANED